MWLIPQEDHNNDDNGAHVNEGNYVLAESDHSSDEEEYFDCMQAVQDEEYNVLNPQNDANNIHERHDRKVCVFDLTVMLCNWNIYFFKFSLIMYYNFKAIKPNKNANYRKLTMLWLLLMKLKIFNNYSQKNVVKLYQKIMVKWLLKKYVEIILIFFF